MFLLPITDLEYRLFAHLVYFDFKNAVDTNGRNIHLTLNHTPVNLLNIKNVIDELEKDLISTKSNLLNLQEKVKKIGSNYRYDYELLLSDWEVICASSQILQGDNYINYLKNKKIKNRLLEAVAFKRIGTNDIVISFKGTHIFNKTFIEDMKENIRMKKIPTPSSRHIQADFAQFFYLLIKKHYPNARITLTGHSKGGVLVQKVILLEANRSDFPNKDLKGITFNSPGILNLYLAAISSNKFFKKFFTTQDLDVDCINYITKIDIVRILAFLFSNYKRLSRDIKVDNTIKSFSLTYGHSIATEFDGYFENDFNFKSHDKHF